MFHPTTRPEPREPIDDSRERTQSAEEGERRLEERREREVTERRGEMTQEEIAQRNQVAEAVERQAQDLNQRIVIEGVLDSTTEIIANQVSRSEVPGGENLGRSIQEGMKSPRRRSVRNWLSKHALQLISLGGLLVSGVSASLALTNLILTRRDKTPAGLSDQEKELYRTMLQEFDGLPEPKFWNEVGQLVHDLEMPLQNQITLLGFIFELAKVEAFTWNEPKDEQALVFEVLIGAYRSRQESRDLYTAMAAYTYAPNPEQPLVKGPIPRRTAATACAAALQAIILFRQQDTSHA